MAGIKVGLPEWEVSQLKRWFRNLAYKKIEASGKRQMLWEAVGYVTEVGTKLRIIFIVAFLCLFLGQLGWTSESEKLISMCKEAQDFNANLVDSIDWLNQEGTFESYSKLDVVNYKALDVPIFDTQLDSKSEMDLGNFNGIKLNFKKSITEVMLIPYENEHYLVIADLISSVSEEEGIKYQEFVKNRTFKDQLNIYLSELQYVEGCKSSSSDVWTKLYVEEILKTVLLNTIDKKEIQVFKGGIIYRHDGALGFISLTPDKKFILKAYTYYK
ncbi:hypothetical protein [Microbulbifer sp. GL-2]|uniref:hypothetical protein n=1 Tax=Microbulbifer sp. GL-2 TaxID=2591606 RepID=UPI0011644E00|nr:hypothetical protein [Microbulbifer sp. GL-2]BBM04142.1 hypothetical protein GL2_42160 [Microbulbifer sp. GL-2]